MQIRRCCCCSGGCFTMTRSFFAKKKKTSGRSSPSYSYSRTRRDIILQLFLVSKTNCNLFHFHFPMTIMDSSNGIQQRSSFSSDTPLFHSAPTTLVGIQASMWTMILQEARAISLWSCLSTLIRMILAFLSVLASESENGRNTPSTETTTTTTTTFWFLPKLLSQEWLFQASGLAALILCLVPSKAALQQAPGFSFSNPWLLLWVRDKTGVIPNVPIRVSEYVMGRIRLGELLVIIPIHVVCIVSTFSFLRKVLPEQLASLALEPIEYSHDGNPWIVDLVREILVTAIFAVSLMVMPILFQLNGLPRWLVVVLLYPLFNYPVHGDGQSSAFSPNVLFALAVLGHRPLPTAVRLLGSLLGGLVGGKVMQLYFPDSNNSSNKVT